MRTFPISAVVLFAVSSLDAQAAPTLLVPTGNPSVDRTTLQNAALAGGEYILSAAPVPWALGTTPLTLVNATSVAFTGQPGAVVSGESGPALWLDGGGTFAIEKLTLASTRSVVGVRRVGGLAVRDCEFRPATGWAATGNTGGWFALFFNGSSTFPASPVPIQILRNRFAGDDTTGDNRGFGIAFPAGFRHHYDAAVADNEFAVVTGLSVYQPNGTYTVERNRFYFRQSTSVGLGIGIYYFNPVLLNAAFGSSVAIRNNYFQVLSTNGTNFTVGIGRMTEYPAGFTPVVRIEANEADSPANPSSMLHRLRLGGVVLHGASDVTIARNRFSGVMTTGLVLAPMTPAVGQPAAAAYACRKNTVAGNDFSTAIVVENASGQGGVAILDNDLAGYQPGAGSIGAVVAGNVLHGGEVMIGGVTYRTRYGVYSKGTSGAYLANTFAGSYLFADVYLREEAGLNYFGDEQSARLAGNTFGAAPHAVIDNGGANAFVNNDYRNTGIGGFKYGDNTAVWLTAMSRDDVVLESGGFPQGTGGAKEQVFDEVRESTGSTTHRVAGHPANWLADSLRPGIGRRLAAVREQMKMLPLLMCLLSLEASDGRCADDPR